ncbi:MAG: glycosyltransferase family 4 protein [Chlorobi bacterium]|nr:glycosyltransferase family 4 protein [Chlorobiota bacterium]
MAKPLQIALVHPENADNVRVWSGTPFFMKRAVEKHLGRVVDLSPAPVNTLKWKILSKGTSLLIRKKAPYDHLRAYSRELAKYFRPLLLKRLYDLIVAPGARESIALLDTDIPIITYSDATWDAVVDYYSVYSNLLAKARIDGEYLEQSAIDKSALFLYSSDWAADSARNHYHADPAKVHTFYLGANLMNPPTREEVLPRKLGKRIRLLLVGVDWEIKGGAIVLQVLKGLIDRGCDARLTVVGFTAPRGVEHPQMEVIPFLNKQIPEERKRFERAWRDADFFILPSRFEAAGLVFCEASAYALPILAARTGGIPSIVKEGKNGFTIPHDEEPEGYIEKIIWFVEHPDQYAQLSLSARIEYENRLNWDTWGTRLAEVVSERFPEFRERIEYHRDQALSLT